jgi:predicted Zn finger-like uncharacterized protein
MIIITCPKCSISYRVQRNAVGGQGRMVRCTRCGESWRYRIGEGPNQTFDTVKKKHKLSDTVKDRRSELVPGSAAKPVIAHNQIIAEKKQSLPPTETKKNIPAILRFGVMIIAAFTCVGFYWNRDQIVDRIPTIKPYLNLLGLKTKGIDPLFKVSDVKLKVEKQGAIASQMVDFSLKNITNQTRELPSLTAIVLDSDRNILDSWKISLHGDSLKPGEARLFSKEIQRGLPLGKTLKLTVSSKD